MDGIKSTIVNSVQENTFGESTACWTGNTGYQEEA